MIYFIIKMNSLPKESSRFNTLKNQFMKKLHKAFNNQIINCDHISGNKREKCISINNKLEILKMRISELEDNINNNIIFSENIDDHRIIYTNNGKKYDIYWENGYNEICYQIGANIDLRGDMALCISNHNIIFRKYGMEIVNMEKNKIDLLSDN